MKIRLNNIFFLSAICFVLTIIFADAYLTIVGNAQKNAPNGGGTFYTVSGNVKADGANLSGATIVFLNGNFIAQSATTDANGDYSAEIIGEQSYVVSVFKDGYNFNPTSRALNNVQANQTANFQNGTRLCVPAPAGQSGEEFCPNSVSTPRSQIQNGKIAFELFSATFAINPDGTNQMQLPPAGSFPSWSPDGTKLLFNRTTSLDFDQEIYITNADGTGFRQITFNFVQDYRAQWSPDGTRAVFFRFFNSSDIEIFSINTDSPNNGINEVQLTNDDCINRDPTYSPDGTKIAFSKFCENEALSGIYTMNVDGSVPFQLTSGYVDLSPSWRPDGERIVFSRDGDLWFVNSLGTATIQLTFDLQFNYFSPVYSPDGTKIAFSRVPSETEFQEIYTLNPLTGEQLRLTFAPQVQNKEYPSWQKIIASVPVTLIGGVNLTFSTVTSGGNTVATPIAPATAGALPSGFRLIPESVAFDVRTSSSFNGNIEICFDLPNINDETLFNSLVIFHNENGELIDRTSARDFAARKIYASVTSLSPFVVAAPGAPTAAFVGIGGRVKTTGGKGIGQARVLLTDANGSERETLTDTFGKYQFENVTVGENYILSVSGKRFFFDNPVQSVSVSEELDNLDFIGTAQW